MKTIIAAMLAALALSYYFFFYPPSLLKRDAGRALSQFEEAVESKDRAKISQSLALFLSDNAEVTLDVKFTAYLQEHPLAQQKFTKAEFIHFIDVTLYPLTDYALYSKSLDVKYDASGAHPVSWISSQWGDGADMRGGMSYNMRYSGDTECRGVLKHIEKTVQIETAHCTMNLRQVLKPEEIGKIKSLNNAMELLKAK